MNLQLYHTVAGGVVTVVGGAAGIYFPWRRHVISKRAPVHADQAERHKALKETLHSFDTHRLEPALKQLETGPAPTSIEADLREVRDYVLYHDDDFIAPTRDQMRQFASTIEAARRAYDETRIPKSDLIFDEDYQREERERVARHLLLVREQARVVVSGINAITKNPFMSERKQVKLFRNVEVGKALTK